MDLEQPYRRWGSSVVVIDSAACGFCMEFRVKTWHPRTLIKHSLNPQCFVCIPMSPNRCDLIDRSGLSVADWRDAAEEWIIMDNHPHSRLGLQCPICTGCLHLLSALKSKFIHLFKRDKKKKKIFQLYWHDWIKICRLRASEQLPTVISQRTWPIVHLTDTSVTSAKN